uniref:ARAD1C14718p n=1 Tax=Blastobotrys adeninivorans TaxID=409370 RepID=A0A060T091_BLAAD
MTDVESIVDIDSSPRVEKPDEINQGNRNDQNGVSRGNDRIDGGWQAWLQVICGHFVVFNSWGYINAWGVFQNYYTSTLPESSSAISWVGSLQIFLLFFIGTLSGRLTDAGYFRALAVAGVLFHLVGIFMTSLCTQYYQVVLAQGICMGIGNGLTFCPTVAVVAPYFYKKRGFAMALILTGSGTGGLVFPAVVRQLIPQVGFGWAVRVLGLLTLVTEIPSLALLKPRVPPRKDGPLLELKAFKELPYLFFTIAMFFNFWGLYVVFFYLSSFARDRVGMSETSASNLVMILSGIGIPGRLIPAYGADKVGLLNMYIPVSLSTVVILYCWIAVKSVAGLYVYAVVYGFFGAAIQALFPGILTLMSKDPTKTGIRVGMTFTVISFGALTGSPIAGVLVSRDNGGYLYAQLFSGTSLCIGAVFTLLCKFFQSRQP